jgi:hypothetical protein
LFEALIVFFFKAVENFFMKGKDGQLGITGEGLLLENAKGKP